jgi:hypothetical protein
VKREIGDASVDLLIVRQIDEIEIGDILEERDGN